LDIKKDTKILSRLGALREVSIFLFPSYVVLEFIIVPN